MGAAEPVLGRNFLSSPGIANMIVAPEIDPFGLQLSEDTWVDFKLFGLDGYDRRVRHCTGVLSRQVHA